MKPDVNNSSVIIYTMCLDIMRKSDFKKSVSVKG